MFGRLDSLRYITISERKLLNGVGEIFIERKQKTLKSQLFFWLGGGEVGWHSTEVVFAPSTQPSLVRILVPDIEAKSFSESKGASLKNTFQR